MLQTQLVSHKPFEAVSSTSAVPRPQHQQPCTHMLEALNTVHLVVMTLPQITTLVHVQYLHV